MKIGLIDIVKAYFGNIELTLNNAFIGREPLLEGGGGGINYLTFTSVGDSTIGLSRLSNQQTIDFSTDKNTWTPMDTSTTISLSNGQSVFIRGILAGKNTAKQRTTFTMGGHIIASGNINTLWNYNDLTAPLKARCGYEMFYNCAALYDAGQLELPATSLSSYCYGKMFYGCSNLVSSPQLPATTLAESCYSNMFQNCTSLTTTTPTLPATTLAESCYKQMFQACVSLTTAPILPATTLQNSCYYSMFSDCTSLTSAPVLPADTLTDSCYYQMFEGCASLNYIKCLATDNSAPGCVWCWVTNVARYGTFVKAASMTDWPIDDSVGIPQNWTIVNA